MNCEASIFWDEEKNRSELRWRGHVLTGTNEATFALMEYLCRIEAELVILEERAADAADAAKKTHLAFLRAAERLEP